VPELVYGADTDAEHIVSTTCLDMTHGDHLVKDQELAEVEKLLPSMSMVRVELYHRPHVVRNITLTPPAVSVSVSGVPNDDEEEEEEEKGEGGRDGKIEHFKKENIEDVSKKKRFNLFAAEPVDFTVTLLSADKKQVLHRPNDPSKRYSVRLHSEIKDYGKSRYLYTKQVDRASRSVSFGSFNYSERASEKNAVVHYFNKIQFNKMKAGEVLLVLDVMDGNRVLFQKEFLVKVS
jgi:hypothetical protein